MEPYGGPKHRTIRILRILYFIASLKETSLVINKMNFDEKLFPVGSLPNNLFRFSTE